MAVAPAVVPRRARHALSPVRVIPRSRTASLYATHRLRAGGPNIRPDYRCRTPDDSPAATASNQRTVAKLDIRQSRKSPTSSYPDSLLQAAVDRAASPRLAQ